MRSAFVSAVFWLGLVASVHPAAVSTQDTIVVARSDDDQSTVVSSTAAEVTTDEPLTPIKLTEMDVRSEVSLRYARTAVVTHVRNAAKKSQEATFRVLLPDSAFISGFVMTLGGKSYKAYVKEKEEAKQIYNDAVSMGLGAAHVSAKARDSNHFTVSVNVEANTTAVFNLTYEELLVRRNGVYNHAINLHPGALVPKMKVVVHIKESQKITQLRVPELRTGNEVDATDEDAQNSKAVIERGNKDREATITFSPDLQEQERLIEIYAAKTKESASHHNSWSNEDNDEKKKEDVLGQFVVQYDVERPKNGEILVNDGYFVHFLAPTSLPPLKKHVVFVLDTSGSMMGRKVEQLRDAMKTILSKLNPGDYFNIVEFNSGVQVHDLKEASEPEPKPTYSYYENSYETSKLLAPEQATPENIEKAKVIVSRLQASGGTNIYSALDVAINLIHKGTGGSSNNSVPTVNEELPRAEASTDAKSPQDNNTAVAKENEDKKDNLEPIIIFLTDGDPTVGETDTGRIISHLTEKNYGERKASIFSLAFGEDADRSFLRKLSLRNEGFMRHIYEAADAALQLRDFYRQVSSPLLSEVKFIYPPEQIKEGSLTRHKFRTVYDGSEAVVAGQIVDDAPEVTPQVLGFCGVDDGVGRKRYEITPKVPVSRVKSEYLPLERLWAYLTVKQLLDERDASDSDQKAENSPEKKALKIALKYEFVTPLTSLVVVKPNETNAVDAESVDKKGGSYSNFAPLSAQYASHAIGAPSAFGFVPPGAGYLSQSLSAAPVSTLDLDSTNLFQESEDLHDRASMSVDSGLQQIYGDLDDRAAFFPRSYIRRPSPPIHMPLFRSGYHHNSVQPRSGYDYYDSIFPGFPDVRFEAEDVDSHYDISTSYVPTTYAPTPALPPSPLAPYHLERCTWAEQALNTTADELVIDVNGTQVNLKLTKENDAPKAADGDAACPAATDGAAGLCVYLTRCDAAANVTAATYSGLYCTVNDKYAGICCPASEVDKKTN